MNENKGFLYICATPIGNLEDITLRVLRVLSEVDIIAAEDTRHTAKLLNHFEIKTPLTSYHENNKDVKGAVLLQKMQDGAKIALVSDAGTPAISDPGRELVNLCRTAGIGITICPGASAGLAALVLSGFKATPHAFEGFLPKDKGNRKKILVELSTESRTMIFYEAPHRLKATLSELHQALGNRQIALIREITKKFEEVKHGKISEFLDFFESETQAPRGEFVVIVEGAEVPAKTAYPEDLAAHVKFYENLGHDEKQAMKLAAKDRGLAKSQIYNELKRK